MASDDIYRSRGRDGNPAGWEAAFYKAVRTGNSAQLDWLLGVRPAGEVSQVSPPPDPVVEFAGHKQALLRLLRSVPLILPRQWLLAWIESVEQLDMAQPQNGLPVLRAMASAYVQAIEQYYSGYSQLMRPVSPPPDVESIGREIERLGSLLYFALVTK